MVPSSRITLMLEQTTDSAENHRSDSDEFCRCRRSVPVSPTTTGGPQMPDTAVLPDRSDPTAIASAAIRPTASTSRWVALIVLCVGMLMIVLDATVVNVALPSIQRDLGFTQAGLAWVVNAYLIAF